MTSIRANRFHTSGLRRPSGFTLVEILVVLVIVGVLTAVALLSFGLLDSERGLDREARRLAALIELASDEATTQGREFGLELMLRGYRFVEHDPLLDQWFEILGDDYLQARDLAEGMEFELTLEERRVLLHEEARKTEKDKNDPRRDLTDDYLPHVLILSSGDVSPFEVKIVRQPDRAEVTLAMSLVGEMEILDDDPQLQ